MKRINSKKEEETRQAEWYKRSVEIACERLQITETQYKQLKKISEELNKLDCDSCNGEISEEEYEVKRDKIFFDKLGTYLTKIRRPFSLVPYHQTDPRGASLYMDDKPMNQSNYTNGVCIY